MLPKALPEQSKPLQTSAREEAFVLLSSASGRTVGFIVAIGRRNIPFGNPAAAKNADRGNMLDILMDGSFLPSETGAYSEMDDMEFTDAFFDLGNRLRRSLTVKDLTSKNLSELEYFMQHINMTEN